MLDRAAQLLGGLEPGEVDGALESHVAGDRPFDDIPMAAAKPEACSLLLMLVRQGELVAAPDGPDRLGQVVCRARLAVHACVSSRSGAQRQGAHDG